MRGKPQTPSYSLFHYDQTSSSQLLFFMELHTIDNWLLIIMLMIKIWENQTSGSLCWMGRAWYLAMLDAACPNLILYPVLKTSSSSATFNFNFGPLFASVSVPCSLTGLLGAHMLQAILVPCLDICLSQPLCPARGHRLCLSHSCKSSASPRGWHKANTFDNRYGIKS